MIFNCIITFIQLTCVYVCVCLSLNEMKELQLEMHILPHSACHPGDAGIYIQAFSVISLHIPKKNLA